MTANDAAQLARFLVDTQWLGKRQIQVNPGRPTTNRDIISYSPQFSFPGKYWPRVTIRRPVDSVSFVTLTQMTPAAYAERSKDAKRNTPRAQPPHRTDVTHASNWHELVDAVRKMNGLKPLQSTPGADWRMLQRRFIRNNSPAQREEYLNSLRKQLGYATP